METALGEALKVMNPRKKREKPEIRVCSCGAPLIWTFFIPYCEWYCLNCGNAGGMFGTGDRVPLTPELRLKKQMVDAVFKVLRKKVMPGGKFGRTGCKKDDREGRYASSCDDHRAHLTKREIADDKLARKYLKRFNSKKMFS